MSNKKHQPVNSSIDQPNPNTIAEPSVNGTPTKSSLGCFIWLFASLVALLAFALLRNSIY